MSQKSRKKIGSKAPTAGLSSPASHFLVEVRRLRSEGENLVGQTEREKQVLAQMLNAAQLEAQQNLRKAATEHQEEVQRLLAEKVRSFGVRESIELYPSQILIGCDAPPGGRKRCGAACRRSTRPPLGS